MLGQSKKQLTNLAFNTGPTKEFLSINKPHFNKPLDDLLNIINDASNDIEKAGGITKMKPSEVFKISKEVQDVTNELASRN